MIIESVGAFWTIGAALLLCFVLLLLIASMFGSCAVVRGQGRGYDPVGLATFTILIILVAGSLPIIVVAQEIDMFGPSPTNDLWPFVLVVLAGLAAAVGAVMTWAAVTIFLPSRPRRRPGLRPRRHRYRLWSYVGIGLTVGGAIWAWQTSFSTAIKVVTVGTTLTIALGQLEKRLTSQLATVPPDMSGHVLYLRAFGTENRALYVLPKERAEFTGQGLRRMVSLDKFLVQGAGERFGQVIALGNPAEFLPPGGATRVYLSDDKWQQELANLARGASLIVMEPGRTQSMSWELKFIATAGMQNKLFILTAPQHRFAKLWRPVVPIMDWLKGWDPPTWSEFTKELIAVGFTVRCADPGAGAVIGFRGDRSAVVIARQLTEPKDFADAMLAHAGRPA